MGLLTRISFVCLCVVLSMPVPVRCGPGTHQEGEAGARHRLTELLGELRGDSPDCGVPPGDWEPCGHRMCATMRVTKALVDTQAGAGARLDRLGKILARPSTQHDVVTPSGHFRIHYDLTGRHAVDAVDANQSGRPDYVEAVAQALDETWTLQVETLGYQPPPSDEMLGGGPEYDVYIQDLAPQGFYGLTWPERGGRTSPSYMIIDNNYLAPIYQHSRGLDAMRVTVAHEFHHAIQFGYYQGSDGIWWQEATATWMEEVAYPGVDDYLQYLRSFLLQPEKALNSGSRSAADFHMYGASLFAHYLHQRHEAKVLRRIWEEFGRWGSADMDHFDRVLRDYVPNGLAASMAEFAVWNYFTGVRHRPGYYASGYKYPEVRMRDLYLDPMASRPAAQREDYVDRLAATYLRLEPGLASGGIVMDLDLGEGLWRPTLMLAAADSVRIKPVVTDLVYVPGWDRYDEVVLVLAQTERYAGGYRYAVDVVHDPELEDEPRPLVMDLRVYPNPVWPTASAPVVLQYDLTEASRDTRLSIYDAVGGLVWSYDLGERPGRTDALLWDGTNQAGESVASGVYHAVLDADGGRVRAKLAIIRGMAR